MKTICKTAAAAAAIAFVLAGAPAAVFAKEAPPAPAEAKPYTLPQMTDYTLPNGMKVTLVPFGNVPKVTVLAAVQTGNIDDGENVWLADMTGMLMEKGAGGRDASQMADAAAAMGGALNLTTGLEMVAVNADVLSEDAPGAVALLGDMLRRPNLDAGELEKVRADLARNLTIGMSNPGTMAKAAFAKHMFPDHPYGRFFPTMAQLQSYTLDQVKAFHAANFGASRTHVYVVGRFDDAAVRKAIADAFGDWAQGKAPASLKPADSAAPKLILIDRPGAPQSEVVIGKRVAKPDGKVDLNAAGTLLGGYFSSRITRNIREDKGYSYSPGAELADNKGGAYWEEHAAVTAEATGPAIAEIMSEIRRIGEEAPSDAEASNIRNYMNGTFVMGLGARGAIAGTLAKLETLGLGRDYLDGYVEKVSALTGADLQAAARRDLQPGQMTVVVVGPLESVRPQLEQVPALKALLPK